MRTIGARFGKMWGSTERWVVVGNTGFVFVLEDRESRVPLRVYPIRELTMKHSNERTLAFWKNEEPVMVLSWELKTTKEEWAKAFRETLSAYQ